MLAHEIGCLLLMLLMALLLLKVEKVFSNQICHTGHVMNLDKHSLVKIRNGSLKLPQVPQK